MEHLIRFKNFALLSKFYPLCFSDVDLAVFPGPGVAVEVHRRERGVGKADVRKGGGGTAVSPLLRRVREPRAEVRSSSREVLLKGKSECSLKVKAGNTKGGSITVLLTSCLTGLESAV